MVNRYNFRQIKHKFYAFLSDESGSVVIEYSVMAACVGCVVMGTVGVIGSEIASTFTEEFLPAMGVQFAPLEVDTQP